MSKRAAHAAVALAVVAGAVFAASALGTPGTPISIAAFGGATSAGACTDASCADRPQNSWSTGTNPAVSSHRLRLRDLNRGIRGPGSERFRNPIQAFTFATTTFKTVADLEAQARKGTSNPWRYATVDLGVGDLCAGTSLATFRTELKRALAVLAGPAQFEPETRELLVLSIEDLAQHWQVVRSDPIAARALQAGARLDCGLGYNVSRTRLEQIRKRTIALNEIVARVCFKTGGCLFDAGTHFRLPLKASYFSPANLRYMSIAGQRALAAAEWKPGYALIQAGS